MPSLNKRKIKPENIHDYNKSQKSRDLAAAEVAQKNLVGKRPIVAFINNKKVVYYE